MTTKDTVGAACPRDDEWISAEKAADVLGVSESTVHRMAHRGLIELGSGYRRYHRPSVEVLRDRGEPMSLSEAGRILHRSIAEVRQLHAAGKLGPFANATFPVFRREIERYADAHPPPSGRECRLNVTTAAEMLGLSKSTVHRLARSGRLPCDRDSRGQYWFRREHLTMYVRTRDAEDSFEGLGVLPTTLAPGS
ncbi:helix-turn-helix domain-containing protein [Kribbella sp. NPDC049227]|uniref:helix-turn-helix domain-containing protein n=1 Tax=Kribbella sp. NPDC049227 TaxID=3364113 RepID=UPI00371FCA3E